MLSEVNYIEINQSKELEKLTHKVVKKCFEEEKLENSKFYINVILTNEKNIRRINKEYRNIDKETDVLSFPMFEKNEIDDMAKQTEIEMVLGDIVISIPRVKEQAEKYGHSIEREFAYMIVHGFYHIIGFDHMTENDKKEMREKEETVLNKLKITREDI